MLTNTIHMKGDTFQMNYQYYRHILGGQLLILFGQKLCMQHSKTACIKLKLNITQLLSPGYVLSLIFFFSFTFKKNFLVNYLHFLS